ncbi:MAG: arylesterase, partial [Dechloromonas agitata]|nr:arylesterase [Dechloromonas agitata]
MRLAFFLFCLLCSTILPAHAAKTVLVMGDSLSAGYGIRPEQAWPALLGARM